MANQSIIAKKKRKKKIKKKMRKIRSGKKEKGSRSRSIRYDRSK